jgi:DnaD/phage-associated family protein
MTFSSLKAFGGFPSGGRFTTVPDLFLNRVLPEIEDLDEVKATLAVFHAVYQKRGMLKAVAFSELQADAGLMRGLDGSVERLRKAIGKAVERDVLVALPVTRAGAEDSLYFINSDASRQAIGRIESGELALPDVKPSERPVAPATRDVPDIFTLYEDNIGLLTPIIADQLRDALTAYPETWVQDAIKQAVTQNKRKWSYIAAVLERWADEGRTDGTHRRDNRKTDPDKYIKGKYGHMVQR